LDFAISEPRQRMQGEIQSLMKAPPVAVPVVIDGREQKSSRTLDKTNPSHPSHVVSRMALATTDQAEAAVQAARNGFHKWKDVPAEERCRILEKAADIMVRDRYALCALEVAEVGKTWVEADGDITEAIDFCRYYAQDMRKLAKGSRVGHVLGENSHYHYLPKGIALVIAPWNFPFAILCGQVAAALVTGNTVIMKPAEQSAGIAYRLFEILREAGLPKDACQFLPGLGEDVGAYLVDHKDVDLIAFTGSKAVGLHILKTAGNTLPGQKGVKRCIIEMGGKNALIIDSDADLDEAIIATLYSAFGFQGQKCSASSRVIVVQENYDRFVDRLIEAARSLTVRPAEDPLAYMGPVVDEEAQQRILKMIEVGKTEGTLAFQGEVPREGFFVPPTIFKDVAPNARIAQEEIFGPVVAIIKAKDIDEAIDIANGVEYGLTGGVFSRSPANIEKVKQRLEVGNLYVNRGITGAMVDRHPFGGFKMSGVGSKTGGPDYLRQFLEPRVITENTVRRGFAPAE
jgi:RHH-type proline utilization regulon transcriptional repressor/proline dehydrogenase/delta 1-pyrroline-5-carboxylate dehydrogenase